MSAVDSHVGKSIFDSVLGPNGALKDTTRIFVTNSLSFLPQVDEVVMLENGRIIQKGTYEQLSSQHGPFAQFIQSHLKTQRDASLVSDKSAGSTPDEAVKQNEVEEVKKTSENIKTLVEEEKVASGRVKWSLAFDYLLACRLWLSSLRLPVRVLQL